MNGFRLVTRIDLELIERTAIHRSKLSETGTRDVTLQKETNGERRGKQQQRRQNKNERKKKRLSCKTLCRWPGLTGGRKGGIIEYNLIEPRVSTPLNRA